MVRSVPPVRNLPPGYTIPLDEAARAAGTVPYEILTTLTPRVPRHYRGAA